MCSSTTTAGASEPVKWRCTSIALFAALVDAASAREAPTAKDLDSVFKRDVPFAFEMFLSEPMVIDPVAMAFDEAGRLYVVENRGYPTGPEMGKIALLENTDRIGGYETRHEFADEDLPFPNGVMCWKGGVFVTCAPDLLYLKDTDGDGRADIRKVVLTGFETTKSTQLRVNDPTLGPDGMVYLASGLSGGKIKRPNGDRVVDIKGGDLRFDPHDWDRFERVDGRCQYGQTFDEAGDRFICMNRQQAQHVVVDSATLKRNPRLRFSDTVKNMAENTVDDLLRGKNAAARIYPISSNTTTADSHAGTFSAACAVTYWKGDLLSCDPTGNLVRRDIMVPDGATFIGRGPTNKREFLASVDDWFRPVFLAPGPNGALYICDMYRETIEHPDYLPKELRKRTSFDGGKSHGRIYAVGRPTFPKARKLVDASLQDLCKSLHSEFIWERDTAFRLLLEREEDAAVPELRAEPLCPRKIDLLAIRGALNSDLIARALRHEDETVRIAGLRHADETKFEAVRRLATDPSARVRMKAALVLGRCQKEDGTSLGKILMKAPNDRWTRAAVLAFAHEKADGILDATLASPGIDGQIDFMAEVGNAFPLKHRDRFVKRVCKIERLSAVPWQIAFLHGLEATDQIPDRMRAFATAILSDSKASQEARKYALMIAQGELARIAAQQLLSPNAPAGLRRVAVGKLVEVGAAGDLLSAERWSGYAPAMRTAVVDAVFADKDQSELLVAAMEDGTISAALLNGVQRKRLIQRFGDRAKDIFAERGGDRREVLKEWYDVAKMKGEGETGRVVFNAHCASCHRLEGNGWNVGPDLFGIRNAAKEATLAHILVPNQEIMPGFETVTVKTKDGRDVAGLLGSETETSVTIRQALGVETTILRDDIEKFAGLDVSLMPDGLEKAMTRQQMADLLAFLKGE